MKRIKPFKYFDWNITDAFITSDEWDARLHDMTKELRDLSYNKKLFKACGQHTFAHQYLTHAEEALRKHGWLESENRSLLLELRSAITSPAKWRVFVQTLRLVTLVARAGVIPTAAQAGREYKQMQTDRAKKTWTKKVNELETRNMKIREHFKQTHLSARRFAELHAAEYGLKPQQIRRILSGTRWLISRAN